MIRTKPEMDKAIEKQLLFITNNEDKFKPYEVIQAKDKLVQEFGYDSPRHPDLVDRIVGLSEKRYG